MLQPKVTGLVLNFGLAQRQPASMIPYVAQRNHPHISKRAIRFALVNHLHPLVHLCAESAGLIFGDNLFDCKLF